VFWDALYNRSENDPNLDAIYQAKFLDLKTTNDQLYLQLEQLKAELAALKGLQNGATSPEEDISEPLAGTSISPSASPAPSSSSVEPILTTIL
jgi:hypothetical protein